MNTSISRTTRLAVVIGLLCFVTENSLIHAETAPVGEGSGSAVSNEEDWRPMDYGFNYVVTRTLTEHFAPFWITSRVTPEQLKRDLLIMRALNSRFVRFCLYPANPQRDSLPGADPVETVTVMDEAMAFAKEIGLTVHLDIFAHPPIITVDEVQAIVRRMKGVVESYQISNEPYFLWRQPDADEHYRHLFELIAAGKAVDPEAKFSVDIFAPDLEDLQRRFPEWYDMLDMHLVHFYAISDHRGWQPVHIEQLVEHLGGTDHRFEELKDERFVLSEFYHGRYRSFENDTWITEITAAGYYRWSNLTPQKIQVSNWKEVCEALARRTNVSRVAHHCFRDKMSYVEWGVGQCGVVWSDDSPKPLAYAFKEMAARSLPDEDLAKWVKVEVNVGDTEVEVLFDNRLDADVSGMLDFETTPDLVLPAGRTRLTLPARSRTRHRVPLQQAAPRKLAISHVFARFAETGATRGDRTVVGWGLLNREREVEIDAAPAPFEGVNYVGGIEAVQDFFRRYPDPVIVFGEATGFDSELAYRLKSVLQGITGRHFDIACAVDARPLLDRPVIVLGNPELNYYARWVEHAAPPESRVSPENKALLAVIPDPFDFRNRGSRTSIAIGYAYSPACLYIAGVDNDHVRRSVYDLIRRMWPYAPEDIAERIRGQHPITGSEARHFRVDLSPGPYQLQATVGQWVRQPRVTTLRLDGRHLHGPFTTADQPSTFPLQVEVTGDHLMITLDTEPDRTAGYGPPHWAIAELEVAHAGLLVDYRHFVFSSRPRDESHSDERWLVTEDTNYTPERGYGWIDLNGDKPD